MDGRNLVKLASEPPPLIPQLQFLLPIPSWPSTRIGSTQFVAALRRLIWLHLTGNECLPEHLDGFRELGLCFMNLGELLESPEIVRITIKRLVKLSARFVYFTTGAKDDRGRAQSAGIDRVQPQAHPDLLLSF